MIIAINKDNVSYVAVEDSEYPLNGMTKNDKALESNLMIWRPSKRPDVIMAYTGNNKMQSFFRYAPLLLPKTITYDALQKHYVPQAFDLFQKYDALSEDQNLQGWILIACPTMLYLIDPQGQVSQHDDHLVLDSYHNYASEVLKSNTHKLPEARFKEALWKSHEVFGKLNASIYIMDTKQKDLEKISLYKPAR